MEVVVAVTEEGDMLTRLAAFDKAVKGASSWRSIQHFKKSTRPG